MLASMIAALLVGAAGGSEAGMTRYQQHKQRANRTKCFSRERESEADRRPKHYAACES